MIKNNTQPSDHGLSGFMFGLTLGALGAFLFGTEEGRSLTKKALDALPENLAERFTMHSDKVPDFNPPVSTPETTPHHAFFPQEAPPPTPPDVKPAPFLYTQSPKTS